MEVIYEISKNSYVYFILFTITNCSETNGLFGKSGADGDPFANISQSSLDYFY